jgi:hypothetical protein
MLVARSQNVPWNSRPFVFIRGFFCMVRLKPTAHGLQPTTAADGRKLHRQLYLSRGCIRVLAIKQGGVADGADADTAAFVGDLLAQRGALVAFSTKEPKLHELVRAQQLLELGEELRRYSAAADLQRRFEGLSASTEK